MIQCEGCYFEDKKDNVCTHENPFFDIDDNCTDYVENEFVKKVRADAIDEFVKAFKDNMLKYKTNTWTSYVEELAKQLKEQKNDIA